MQISNFCGFQNFEKIDLKVSRRIIRKHLLIEIFNCQWINTHKFDAKVYTRTWVRYRVITNR